MKSFDGEWPVEAHLSSTPVFSPFALIQPLGGLLRGFAARAHDDHQRVLRLRMARVIEQPIVSVLRMIAPNRFIALLHDAGCVRS